MQTQPMVGALVQERRGQTDERLARAYFHQHVHRGPDGLAAALIPVA
ncbi:hypothetical protein O3S80_53165 [Streptomyces sp. Lzd4kr]|nr:hypothetical protein [Streptomyces sp. Lzd4kr]